MFADGAVPTGLARAGVPEIDQEHRFPEAGGGGAGTGEEEREGGGGVTAPSKGAMPSGPGGLLPALDLVSVTTGAAVDLRAARGPRALVAMHSVACADCRAYVRERLAPVAPALLEWGGRLAVVVPDGRANAAGFAETTSAALEILVAAGRAFPSDHAVVTVVDEWGEVYFMADAGAGHELPAAEELVAWIRFLAIQCPECEGPEGEWKALR
jgi:hypothetical protein